MKSKGMVRFMSVLLGMSLLAGCSPSSNTASEPENSATSSQEPFVEPVLEEVRTTASGGWSIVSGFGGANVEIFELTDNKATIDVQLRDTTEDWFYWCFRVDGAAGKTITFDFTGYNRVGYYGAAVSHDFENWHWQYETTGHNGSSFTYTFGEDENAVYFAHHSLYRPARFFEFAAENGLEVKTLCQSNKGRAVPYVEFGEGEEVILLTARHHACESTGSYVLEGIIKQMLSDEFFNKFHVICVPFVDYDGVIEGDQGKSRGQRDFNHDYRLDQEPLWNSVAALRQIGVDYKVRFAFDLHSPWHLGAENDHVYFTIRNAAIEDNIKTFSALLQNGASGDTLRHLTANDSQLTTSASSSVAKSFASYFGERGAEIAVAMETPYFEATGRAVTQARTVQLGVDFANALKAYCEGQ